MGYLSVTNVVSDVRITKALPTFSCLRGLTNREIFLNSSKVNLLYIIILEGTNYYHSSSVEDNFLVGHKGDYYLLQEEETSSAKLKSAKIENEQLIRDSIDQ